MMRQLRHKGDWLALLIAALFLSAVAHARQPESIRQYQFEASDGAYRLVMKQVPMPVAGRGEVVVRVHATSLNRRDIYMRDNRYGASGSATGGIPLSDGAGEVIAIGEGVSRFSIGDRVAGTFFPRWSDGNPSADSLSYARGGSDAGMLSEYIVSSEDALVAVPGHLSYEEAATLPCAALTAWVGLFKRGGLATGDFVLLEGTGGVSVFGLQFSAAAGARPIITSSRDEKLARARDLGAVGTVNYRTNPDWQEAVLALTDGAGVDQVLEVGGRDTLPKALQALAYGGHIALIGGLSGSSPDIPPGALMWRNATASGIYVGSRADFEAMNEFVAEHRLKPLIDRVFAFEDAAEAFDYMADSSFMGKIVIRID
jgi:NADPH:quinone reductase-like Zn-dependent oxidoreductase